nr:pancreatic lipase-related protein 2-like [Parasteatoda tepidariorum]
MKYVFMIYVCIAVTSALLSKIKQVVSVLNPLNVLYTNVCVTDLGCFYTGPPFHHLVNRPISLPPTKEPGTKFQLFTPSNPHEVYHLNVTRQSILNSTYDAKHKTKVLIHGFASDLNQNDFRYIMKKAILEEGNYNVIVVDWTADNGFPYAQAVANTRTTGALIAKMINLIINTTRARASDFHLVGHSLGSHVAGYVGERVKDLGRITGLDPAGPYFQVDDKSVRLDPSDAFFVDVIHTSAADSIMEGLGMEKPVGHVDFYPNGGKSQLGCDLVSRTSEVILGRELNSSAKFFPSACDHERANEFFSESVKNSSCQFIGVLCNSYEDFEKKNCTTENSITAVMGFHARKRRGLQFPSKFYLKTNDSYPFCIKSKQQSIESRSNQSRATNQSRNNTSRDSNQSGNNQSRSSNQSGNSQSRSSNQSGNNQSRSSNQSGNSQSRSSNQSGNNQSRSSNQSGNSQSRASNQSGNSQSGATNRSRSGNRRRRGGG